MTNLSIRRACLGLLAACALGIAASMLISRVDARQTAPWTFVASGDARNCGDIVAPGIAETARKAKAAFYWHLGDLRLSTGIDDDIAHQPEHVNAPLSREEYGAMEWQDFIDNQMTPYGSLPYFIGIGNHEVAGGRTREEFVTKFTSWLDAPVLKNQREKDTPADLSTKAYYHWIDRGVAFYYLDNASADQVVPAQLNWFQRALAKDSADPAITSVVVGMHKPLPDGYNTGHSMNESPTSTATGRYIYGLLLQAQNVAHKKVYVLASHQHFYMPDAYDTPYWREHGGVIPGWVVGTAGAYRYTLPIPSPEGSLTHVYGSVVGTVQPSGEIRFEFKTIAETDIPASIPTRYGAEFVRWCFAENSDVR